MTSSTPDTKASGIKAPGINALTASRGTELGSDVATEARRRASAARGEPDTSGLNLVDGAPGPSGTGEDELIDLTLASSAQDKPTA